MEKIGVTAATELRRRKREHLRAHRSLMTGFARDQVCHAKGHLSIRVPWGLLADHGTFIGPVASVPR